MLLNLLVCLLIQFLPLSARKSTNKQPYVDKVKLVGPCPWFVEIVHFKDTVWCNPLSRRRIKIDTVNREVWKHVRHIIGPALVSTDHTFRREKVAYHAPVPVPRSRICCALLEIGLRKKGFFC